MRAEDQLAEYRRLQAARYDAPEESDEENPRNNSLQDQEPTERLTEPQV